MAGTATAMNIQGCVSCQKNKKIKNQEHIRKEESKTQGSKGSTASLYSHSIFFSLFKFYCISFFNLSCRSLYIGYHTVLSFKVRRN